MLSPSLSLSLCVCVCVCVYAPTEPTCSSWCGAAVLCSYASWSEVLPIGDIGARPTVAPCPRGAVRGAVARSDLGRVAQASRKQRGQADPTLHETRLCLP